MAVADGLDVRSARCRCGSGRRADAIGQTPEQLRETGLGGTPAEVVDKIGAFAAAGATRIYLQTLDLSDLDHLNLVAAEVVPQL